MSTTHPTSKTQTPTEEDDPMVRSATYEHRIGSHWLQFYNDGHMEIVDRENYRSGNEHGQEIVHLTPAEVTELKNHLCSS